MRTFTALRGQVEVGTGRAPSAGPTGGGRPDFEMPDICWYGSSYRFDPDGACALVWRAGMFSVEDGMGRSKLAELRQPRHSMGCERPTAAHDATTPEQQREICVPNTTKKSEMCLLRSNKVNKDNGPCVVYDCLYECASVCIQAHMYIFLSKYTYTHTYIYIYTYNIYIYIYIYVYIHTYIHI